MKKALLLVIAWFILCTSSSFACNLCTELEKRGFPPENIAKSVSAYFGSGSHLKIGGAGKPFYSANGVTFNLVVDRNGKIYHVKGAKNLRGVIFSGTLNSSPVKIFVIDEMGFVGIKTKLAKINTLQQTVKATKAPIIVTENKATIKYSDEVIQVPADTERR